MNKFWLLFGLLLSVSLAAAQEFTARVVDPQGRGISYANIGIVGTSRGTVSDKDGYFMWPQAVLSEEERVRISAIGFADRNFSGFDFFSLVAKAEEISLQTRIYQMPTVNVESSKGVVKLIGNPPNKVTANYRVNTSLAGSEIGIKVKAPKGPYAIRKFAIHVAEIKRDRVNFRLNIYEYRGDTIGERVNTKNILLQIHQTGMNTFDLSTYNLSTQGDVFVSLEYIDYTSDANLLLQCNLTGGTVWYKQGVQNIWQKLKREDAGGLRIAPCYQIEVLY